MDKGWKAFERRASRDMGVERQPVTGERHGADNAPHPLFAFQFKLRKVVPSWLFAWLGGIVDTATRDGKVGVLVLKRPRMDDADAVVCVRWRDWVDLHGPVAFGSGAHRAVPQSDVCPESHLQGTGLQNAQQHQAKPRRNEPRFVPRGAPRESVRNTGELSETTPTTFRKAVIAAFHEMGGADAFVKWANQTGVATDEES